ncbi:Protein NRT1/ PTR FAMILY 4.4 [Rhynchospora pubera]|uniref:Protein NRT1/ PTR FAMILY 4.4 n=1 Tax=Rhynchospora pubera TaxID=906938 RepID=A0AAV8CCU7_9POAL|nr:Protein NRT1/ PTR FAMILY 4.4 [Rhynchospora pubera]
MDIEARHEVSVDWKGRPCRNNKHGGMRAAVFVLGIQAFEIMAIAAVGNNLITYVFNEMHFALSKSANIVTNFIGTIFLLSLLGGFLSDSYLGSFWTMLIFGFVELSGFILLSVQAHLPQLKPPKCNMLSAQNICEEAKGFKSNIFFIALYLVALGSGCLKPNMIAHGADQFRKDDPQQSKKLSTYFNTAYFSFCFGELIALTFLVWVQTRSGMDIGFGMSAASMAFGLVSLVSGIFFYRNKPPQGSIFTPIARVFVAAITKRKQVCPSNPEVIHRGHANPQNHVNSINRSHDSAPYANKIRYTNKLRFLDKACIKTQDHDKESPWRLCTAAQVEQVKSLILVIPIFACTIVFNTVLAQLQTFSVQQGALMDNRLFSGSFKVPPASLQSIPYILMILLVPLYELLFVPFVRGFTGVSSGITPLQRIGVGLFTVTFSMVTAAMVEQKRRESVEPISILWIAPQFLVFGLSEMFTAVGLIEFFYKQSLAGMQSFLTSMTYCSYSFGFYLSSVLVSLINKFTSEPSTHSGWLSDNDLNKDRLDLFYWLLAALSILNFFNYLFWSRWYSTSIQPDAEYVVDTNGEEEQRIAFSKEGANETGTMV